MQNHTEMAAQAEARRQAAAAIAEYDARRRARGIIIEAAAEGDNWAIGILDGADEELCDWCGWDTPNGHGHYINDDTQRICGDCYAKEAGQ